MVALTRRRLVASVLALCGATAVTVSSVATEDVLIVADAETDEHLFEIPVEQGQEVTIAYTHSVERTPVEDVYVVDGNELRADRSVFHSFGAGLPTDVERTDEGYVADGSGSYAELSVTPGEIAGHELVVGEDRYDLAAAADGSVVLFVTDRSAVTVPVTGTDVLGRAEAAAADRSRTNESAESIESTNSTDSVELRTTTDSNA